MKNQRIGFRSGRDIISSSKTSCFGIAKMAFSKAKDGILESKTSCFAMSDSSDR